MSDCTRSNTAALHMKSRKSGTGLRLPMKTLEYLAFTLTLKTTMAKADAAKALTKPELIDSLMAATELPRKDVLAVMDALTEEIKNSFGKKGPKAFVLPGLVKIDLKDVPKKPAKKGVKNYLTGETYDMPAKPARKKIRVRALKALKDLV